MFVSRSTGSRRRALACLVAAVAVVGTGVLALPSQPAAAAPSTLDRIPDGDYIIENVASHMVLDIPGASTAASTAIQLWNLNGSKAQQFHFTRQPDGSYEIRNLGSKMNLDVRKGSTASGALIQQYTVNHTVAQRWWLEGVGTSTVRFINVGSGMALDVVKNGTVRGTGIQQYTRNNTTAQSWLLAVVNPNWHYLNQWVTIGRDGFVIEAPACVDLLCPLTAVTLAKYPTGATGSNLRQQWMFTTATSATYGILSDRGKLLVPQLGRSDRGAPMVTDPSATLVPRLSWSIIPSSAVPYYSFKNQDNMALDIRSGTIQAGTVLQIWPPNYSDAQKFEVYIIPSIV